MPDNDAVKKGMINNTTLSFYTIVSLVLFRRIDVLPGWNASTKKQLRTAPTFLPF